MPVAPEGHPVTEVRTYHRDCVEGLSPSEVRNHLADCPVRSRSSLGSFPQVVGQWSGLLVLSGHRGSSQKPPTDEKASTSMVNLAYDVGVPVHSGASIVDLGILIS